jgi:LysM repeat protein
VSVIQYTVQPGDTVYGIAEKFHLKPETILWGNYEALAEDPHALTPGMKLYILPVDGVYYEWKEGDDLNEVASRFGVDPEVIIDWPGNHLNPATLGDLSNPNIKPGLKLVIPGGKIEFPSRNLVISPTP